MVTIKKDNKLFDKVYNEISSGCNKSGRPLTYSEEVMMEITIKALVEEQKKELNSYFIPLKKAGDIHYGHRNDTIEMAYLRGRNEIINELRNVLFGDEK